MPWPTMSDYNEAVQNPKHSFADPELCAGTVRTNRMGLPIPISGGFATVYQVQSGPRIWAVRCFQRYIPDQQQRYAAIGQHLMATRLPYMVGFTYLPQGIRVRGQWFPILKMGWIKGESLNSYIEKNLRNSAALLQLANQFLSMVADLQRAQVAHGDLQHGNILVANGSIKLIDYDGMYVPNLAGCQSHETGHRNFQHPKRNSTHFGLYLDNFSVWVIYLSIVALSIDSSLWQRTGAGDESLLFHKEDFERPDTSPVLSLLTKHPDPRLQGLANLFASALYTDPTQVPPMQAAQIAVPSIVKPTLASKPDWLKDYLQTRSPSGPVPVPRPVSQPLSHNIGWVLDFVSPPNVPKCFIGSLLIPRLSLAVLLASVLIILLFHMPVIVTCGLIGIVAVAVAFTLFACYHSDPVLLEKKPLLLELRQHMAAREELQRVLNSMDGRKAGLKVEHNKSQIALSSERAAFQRKEEHELAVVRKQLTDECRAIEVQISDLEKPIQRIRANTTSNATRIQQQLSQHNQAEANEISAALRHIQQQFLANYLRQRRIDSDRISGIGSTLAARLAARGYVTAADINWAVTNVYGIGHSKAVSLMGWRRAAEQNANAAMPQSLPQPQLSTIQARYQSQRMQLQQQIISITRTAQQNEQAIRAQIAMQVQQLQESRNAAHKKAQQQEQAIKQRYQQSYSSIAQKEAQAGNHLASELKKADAEVSQTQKRVFDTNWQIAVARRNLESYSRITLIGYLQQMLGIRSRIVRRA